MSKPQHYSHSQVSSWLRCGKAYELERIVRVPRAPAVYLVTGNALHSAIERLSLAAYAKQSKSVKSDSSDSSSQHVIKEA
jgi:hypothetical protein